MKSKKNINFAETPLNYMELKTIIKRCGYCYSEFCYFLGKSKAYFIMVLERRFLIPVRFVDALKEFIGEENFYNELNRIRRIDTERKEKMRKFLMGETSVERQLQEAKIQKVES